MTHDAPSKFGNSDTNFHGHATHYVVRHDPRERLVRVTRTAVPLATSDVATVLGALNRTIDVDRPSSVLLMDVRLGPSNNDPEFEVAMARPVRTLYAGFRRRAVLVRSAAGALQIRRLAHERHLRDHDLRVFVDEAAALHWLRA